MNRLGTVLLLSLLSCSHVLPLAGFPPHAMRKEAPPAIDGAALAVGAAAPDFELDGTTRTRLSDRLKDRRAVLVFYRGDW